MRRWLTLSVLLALALMATGCVGADGGRFDSNEAQAAVYNTQLGYGYMRQDKYQIAMDKFRRALEQAPELPQAHSGIAELYARLQRYEDAEAHHRRAVSLSDREPEMLNRYGAFLCNRGRDQEAIELFEEAAQATGNAQPAQAYSYAGSCALQSGKTALGERFFRRALQVSPRHPQALWSLAKLNFQRQEYLQARAFLQRYHEVANPRAASLYLGVQVERALGDQRMAEEYAQRLQREYPESEAAARLRQEN